MTRKSAGLNPEESALATVAITPGPGLAASTVMANEKPNAEVILMGSFFLSRELSAAGDGFRIVSRQGHTF